jgi:hypothetical protein
MTDIQPEELLSEYDFDYAKAQTNRFAGRAAVAVALQAEVGAYLQIRADAKGQPLSDLVNDLLRRDIALIESVR